MIDAIIIILIIALLIWALKRSLKCFKGDSPCCKGSHTIKEKKLQSPILGKKILEIEGMHCQNCTRHVINAINSIEGASAKVDLDRHLAIVSYDRELNDHELYDVIEEAGYHIQSIMNKTGYLPR